MNKRFSFKKLNSITSTPSIASSSSPKQQTQPIVLSSSDEEIPLKKMKFTREKSRETPNSSAFPEKTLVNPSTLPPLSKPPSQPKTFTENGPKIQMEAPKIVTSPSDPYKDADNPNLEIERKQRELQQIRKEMQKLQQKATQLEVEIDSLRSYVTEQEREALRIQRDLHYNEPDWTSSAFQWSQDLDRLARQKWNITAFRHRQREVLNATLSGKDVFYIAPTGGGKSLTFQLPAILAGDTGFAINGPIQPPQFSLVISPLISLSKDQIMELRQINVKAAMIWGETSKEEEKLILQEMLQGSQNQPLLLVYVTPEKIAKSKRFIAHLEKCFKANRIARVVVDEAHCASQFGHDFRPDYLKLGILRTLMPTIPILCLSATCPPTLLNSCMDILGLSSSDIVGKQKGTLVISTDLRRSNLHYQVLSLASQTPMKEIVQQIIKWIHQQADTFRKAGLHNSETIPQGLLYALTKKDAENFAQALREQGIQAGIYHADVDGDDRERVHELWRQGRIQIICATPAFGLGISLPHVRFVVHTTPPPTLDRYYQESGRVGRDLKPASCLLLYRRSEWSRVWSLCSDDLKRARAGIEGMRRYCEEVKECRVRLMERWFGARSQDRIGLERVRMNQTGMSQAGVTPCGNCDVCQRETQPIELDVTSFAVDTLEMLNLWDHSKEKLTLNKLLDLMAGKGMQKAKLEHPGIKEPIKQIATYKITKVMIETIIIHLILLDYIKEDFHFTAYATNVYLQTTDSGMRFVRMFHMGNKDQIKLNFTSLEEKKVARSKTKISAIPSDEILDSE